MSDQLNLEQLKEDAEALGEKVKKLKEDGADAEAIKAAVADLLAVKKRYAENNNGIGVDGKPYDEPMTKAQKKAKERAEKQKEAVDANPVSDNDFTKLEFEEHTSAYYPLDQTKYRKPTPVPKMLKRRPIKRLPRRPPNRFPKKVVLHLVRCSRQPLATQLSQTTIKPVLLSSLLQHACPPASNPIRLSSTLTSLLTRDLSSHSPWLS
jgi:hypothetical protein